jgi:hypothetical protein
MGGISNGDTDMPTATIKPVRRAAKGHNRFCGPAALSIIAGIDTAEAAALIRHVSRKRSVTGTTFGELLCSLALLGFGARSVAKVDPLYPKFNPTLAAWLKSEDRDGKALYLIAAGNHWQVVQGRRFCCGLTREIVSIRDDKVKRRARITGVWEITHNRKVALCDVLPKAAPKAKDSEAAVRRKARRLAAEHNIEIETYRDGEYSSIIVWGPRGVDLDNDPFEGDHYADGWTDALGRVEEYVKLFSREALTA